MPATYNLPRSQAQWNQQDIELYNKLPFYLANNEAKLFPMYKCWDKFTGTVKWEPNMGNIMKGVRAEFTPIQSAEFFPNDITSAPKKDVFEVRETAETARVKRHLFESAYFNFNPSFADFRRNQIQFAMKDIVQQIAQRNDMFIRSTIFHRSPYVIVSGRAGEQLIAAPFGDGNDAGTTGKTTAFLQQCIADLPGAGNFDTGSLSYKMLVKSQLYLSEDLMAPAFEGMANVPKDNETIKGKWLVVGSREAWSALSFDEYITANRPIQMNLLNDEFAGVLNSHIAYKTERFPLRIAADGTIPGPQTWESNPDAWNYGMTVPNPAYVNAPFEVAFAMGAEAYKSITVGAPPKEFTSGSMDAGKFSKLMWNGEVRLTDNVIVNYGDGKLDTNKYGEFVQLIADATMGILPVNRRYCVPIIYRRRRVVTN